MSKFSDACCNTPPVASDYVSKGTMGQLGDVKCYFAGNKGSKRSILVNYDVFGFHSNVLQLCDILGGLGFYVILPDFLRSNPLTEADIGSEAAFGKFIRGPGSWKGSAKPLYERALEYLREEQGNEQVALVGFCWGAKMVLKALDEFEGLKGGAIVHPALVEIEDFDNIKAPLLALPSKDEDQELYAKGETVMKGKAFGDKCKVQPFNDMFHGFCGARGDWSQKEQAERANDAIKAMVQFFNNIFI